MNFHQLNLFFFSFRFRFCSFNQILLHKAWKSRKRNWIKMGKQKREEKKCYNTLRNYLRRLTWPNKAEPMEMVNIRWELLMSFYILHGMWNRWPTSSRHLSDNDFSRIFSVLRNQLVGVARTTEISHPAFTICITKRYSQRRRKNPRTVESETEKQLAFFNSLHTDARFYVEAIRYYVSLHTSAESTFYAFFLFCLAPKTRFFLFFLSFFCCSIHVHLFLYFYMNNFLPQSDSLRSRSHVLQGRWGFTFFLLTFAVRSLGNRVHGESFVVACFSGKWVTIRRLSCRERALQNVFGHENAAN